MSSFDYTPVLGRDLYRQQIRAVCRAAAAELLQHRAESVEGAAIDHNTREIVVAGERRRLKEPEYRILACLARSPGQSVDRDRLIAAIYAHRDDGGPLQAGNAFRVYLCRLRKKSPWPIRSDGWCGYVLEGYRAPRPQLADGRAFAVPRERVIAGR